MHGPDIGSRSALTNRLASGGGRLAACGVMGHLVCAVGKTATNFWQTCSPDPPRFWRTNAAPGRITLEEEMNEAVDAILELRSDLWDAIYLVLGAILFTSFVWIAFLSTLSKRIEKLTTLIEAVLAPSSPLLSNPENSWGALPCAARQEAGVLLHPGRRTSFGATHRPIYG